MFLKIPSRFYGKKSSIIKQENQIKAVSKYLYAREECQHYLRTRARLRSPSSTKQLKTYLRNGTIPIHKKLQNFPRNSIPIRLRSRCQLSGRSRGYYRRFGLSRHFFRELALQGILPGVRKSSW